MSAYAFRAFFVSIPFMGQIMLNRSWCGQNLRSIDEEFKEYRRAFWRIDGKLVEEAERWQERERDRQCKYLYGPLYKQLCWPPHIDHDLQEPGPESS